jgi:branched-chain amino acid aminotransferase
MNCFATEGIPFFEAEITHEELLNASEVFLTNAIYGVRWVKKVANSNYNNATSSFLYQKFIVPLFGTATI